MKFYVSYYYQIRFMNKNVIPLSTAVYPPKWFDKGEIYFDKNGVANGITCDLFVPGPSCCNLCHGHTTCTYTPDNCEFLKAYYEQISSVSKEEFIDFVNEVAEILGIENPEVVLIVHEAPDNPCSERVAILQWFKDNGLEVSEFSK